MCGIIGYAKYNVKGREEVLKLRGRVEEALVVLRPRGPDGEGVAVGDNWVFGHTRLAVLDPAGGVQPMIDEPTGTTLTYNGEIYNFKDIRTELEAKGRVFRTNCDTEVVLASYLEWGEDCVRKFNGFFAFVIADPRRNVLFSARDRLGIKPFYYHEDEEGFCFCSSPAGILRFYGRRFGPDMEAVSNYLSTGRTVFGERTLLDGVRSLPPGHTLRIRLGWRVLDKRRYWGLPTLSPAEKQRRCPSFGEAVEKTRELLRDSVRMRLLSDVPVGAFLSGGLDSSIIASCVKSMSGHNLPLFCAGSDEESLNEFSYAREMAGSLGGELTEIRLDDEDFSRDWGRLIASRAMPLSTPNEISIYRLSKALREKCVVALTGEGADEIFGGYVQPHFSAYDFDRSARAPEGVDLNDAFSASMYLLYGRAFFINDTDHYTATSCWMSHAQKRDLFDPGIWNGALEEDNAFFLFYEEYFDGLKKCSSFDKRMHLHADFNLESLLSRVDNSSMAASVEARVPFNDHRIAEFAFSLPDSYKMDWRSQEAMMAGRDLTSADIDKLDLLETKRLPRGAFGPELPREIVLRRKMSFPVPFERWFHKELKDTVRPLVFDSKISRECFSVRCVDNMLRGQDRNIWLLANLCKWHDSVCR